MEIFKITSSTIATVLTFICGGWDLPIKLLIFAIVLDFITGLIRSGIKGEINSSIGFKGFLKKVGMLCVVGVGVIIDQALNAGGGVRLMVIYYIIATEGISIIENLGQSGVPFPDKLKKILTDLQEKSEKTEKE